MQAATLYLMYLIKYAELGILASLTALIMASGFWLTDTIRDQNVIDDLDKRVIICVYICQVLVLFNLFYNTLLLNLRFLAKMKCVTTGICIFDCINYLICFKILRKPCENRLFNFWLLAKWVITGAICGYTYSQVSELKDKWDE